MNRTSTNTKPYKRTYNQNLNGSRNWINLEFKCQHCHCQVSADPYQSGVNHRNHCPYCLWSRHLDWLQPGDRLSACKAPMRPIGLTLKRNQKKYGDLQGELMVIHLCTDCGKVSINRLAADDAPHKLWEVYEGSLSVDFATAAAVKASGVRLLNESDRHLVEWRLYGELDRQPA